MYILLFYILIFTLLNVIHIRSITTKILYKIHYFVHTNIFFKY